MSERTEHSAPSIPFSPFMAGWRWRETFIGAKASAAADYHTEGVIHFLLPHLSRSTSDC